MAHPYHEHRAHHVEKAHKVLSRTGHSHYGFARGGHVHEDAAEDEKMVAAGVHKHEAHMHKGEPKTKLKDGGCVEGERGHHHMAHRARGGKTGGGKHTKVNVIIAPQGGGGGGAPAMGAARPPMAAAPPPHPPMPPAGGPPPMPPPAMTRPGMGMPGAAPPMGAPPPGMMRARGGKVHMEAGSGSGPGRLEKMKDYGGSRGFKPKMREKA